MEEAGDFISKLLSIGCAGLVGITDKLDTSNAEDRGISAKRHLMSGYKVDSGDTMFARLQKDESYKGGMTKLAHRIADTGRTVVPLVVLKDFLVMVSKTGAMNSGGCNLEAIVHGLDSYLIKQNVSFVAMEGEVLNRSSFAPAAFSNYYLVRRKVVTQTLSVSGVRTSGGTVRSPSN